MLAKILTYTLIEQSRRKLSQSLSSHSFCTCIRRHLIYVYMYIRRYFYYTDYSQYAYVRMYKFIIFVSVYMCINAYMCRDAIRHAFSVLAVKGSKHRVSHCVCMSVCVRMRMCTYVCVCQIYVRTVHMYVHT